MLLIDTHVLLWLDEGSPKLGAQALRLIDSSLQGNALAVSSITFWETAMLVQKGRLSIAAQLPAWRKELLTNGLVEIPVTGDIALAAGTLEDFHGDPADRIIAATAMIHDAALLTADKKILAWSDSRALKDAARRLRKPFGLMNGRNLIRSSARRAYGERPSRYSQEKQPSLLPRDLFRGNWGRMSSIPECPNAHDLF